MQIGKVQEIDGVPVRFMLTAEPEEELNIEHLGDDRFLIEGNFNAKSCEYLSKFFAAFAEDKQRRDTRETVCPCTEEEK
jgi:hemolysin-activating ACP:hemolysin acyltransferase